MLIELRIIKMIGQTNVLLQSDLDFFLLLKEFGHYLCQAGVELVLPRLDLSDLVLVFTTGSK